MATCILGRSRSLNRCMVRHPTSQGRAKANPLAALVTGAMMMTYLGENTIAQAIEESVKEVIESGEVTHDLGGTLNTAQAGEAVQRRVLAKL